MYEKLHSSIPDISTYLDRLQIPAPAQTDLDYLDQFIYTHQQQIVFENLDSCELKKRISLEIPALFHKIIINQRGGYCFELNALCAQLLKDLGYHTYGCMSRVIRGRDPIQPALHRVNLAELGNHLYFYDVGFGGPMPPCALPVEDGCSRTMHGETYHMKKADDYWWTVSRTTSQGESEPILQFYTMPQDNAAFIPNNEYCCSCPDSIFTQVPFLNRRTPDGSIGILGNVLTIVRNGTTTRKNISDKKEFHETAEHYFGLKFPVL